MTRVVVVVGGDKMKIKTSKENSELEFLYTVCGFCGANISTPIVLEGNCGTRLGLLFPR